MKLYFWDKTAIDLCKKFTAYENTLTLLLVTKVNTKRLGGNHSPFSIANHKTKCFPNFSSKVANMKLT